MKKIKILFVCLGNICRSPMAEFVMRHLVEQNLLSDYIDVDSAGTSGWHDGENMHRSSYQMLKQHGIDCKNFVSKRLPENALQNYDYVAVMDDSNLSDVYQCLGYDSQRIFKLTDFCEDFDFVPDPWYTGNFFQTYHIINECCLNWIRKLKQDLGS